MFGSKRKDQKWLEITVYQKKYTIKHFILYILALKGPNLLSNTYFGKFLFTLDSTQCTVMRFLQTQKVKRRHKV